MKNLAKSKDLVVLSNAIIEARLLTNFEANEFKLFLAGVSMIKKEDKEFTKYKIGTETLRKVLNIENKKWIYSAVKEIAKKMSLKSAIEIEDKKNKQWAAFFLFSSLSYKNGNLTIKFNEDMKPFFLQLKKNFTKFQLSEFKKLRSKYSIRIYQLLKQYQNIGERTLEIQNLRTKLGIEPNELKQFIELRRRVLNPAQRELEPTPMAFVYTPIKEGRKFTKIKFTLINKSVEPEYHAETKEIKTEVGQNSQYTAEIGRLYTYVPNKYKTKQLDALFVRYISIKGYDYTHKNIQYVLSKHIKKNFVNYFSKALAEDYAGAEKSDIAEEIEKKERIAADRKKRATAAEAEKKKKEEAIRKIDEYIYALSPAAKTGLEKEVLDNLHELYPNRPANSFVFDAFTVNIGIRRIVHDRIFKEKLGS